MKKWKTLGELKSQKAKLEHQEVIDILLKNRGFTSKKEIQNFLNPQDPYLLSTDDVEIDRLQLKKSLARIEKAIGSKESIVVYTDYDADGITAGTIMWETLHRLGARVMPYVPHREKEGYGFSKTGIDAVKIQFDPTLIITVDHGITAREKIAYAKSLGIDVIVTDHHVKPEKIPDCLIVHTTKICGAGVSWFVAKELLKQKNALDSQTKNELLALAAVGTIADLVPLVGANRAIVKFGLAAVNQTQRVGLKAILKDAGLEKATIGTYEISHMVAPRLNAMGRIVHALDALRLLCTKDPEKARRLAEMLGATNRDRQQMTIDTVFHAKELMPKTLKKLIFISHVDYNQGVIGLVAGKLVESYYRPAIVVARGEKVSKASARSITGFNIIEAIRSCMDILVDAGGHPMAAGFTVATEKLEILQARLEEVAEKVLNEETLTRVLKIDLEISLNQVTEELWNKMQEFAPFGMGNPEPVFATRNVSIQDIRLVGAEGRHLKLKLKTDDSQDVLDAIGFGLGSTYGQLSPSQPIDIAYTIDLNQWNGSKSIQLKLKDIVLAN